MENNLKNYYSVKELQNAFNNDIEQGRCSNLKTNILFRYLDSMFKCNIKNEIIFNKIIITYNKKHVATAIFTTNEDNTHNIIKIKVFDE